MTAKVFHAPTNDSLLVQIVSPCFGVGALIAAVFLIREWFRGVPKSLAHAFGCLALIGCTERCLWFAFVFNGRFSLLFVTFDLLGFYFIWMSKNTTMILWARGVLAFLYTPSKFKQISRRLSYGLLVMGILCFCLVVLWFIIAITIMHGDLASPKAEVTGENRIPLILNRAVLSLFILWDSCALVSCVVLFIGIQRVIVRHAAMTTVTMSVIKQLRLLRIPAIFTAISFLVRFGIDVSIAVDAKAVARLGILLGNISVLFWVGVELTPILVSLVTYMVIRWNKKKALSRSGQQHVEGISLSKHECVASDGSIQ